MGDACLGITRLRAVASSSHALRPFESEGPFIDDAEVNDLLAERQKLDRSLLDPPLCVDFKAAKPLGKLSPIMDTTGMAALVCRHEFVAVAVNMFQGYWNRLGSCNNGKNSKTPAVSSVVMQFSWTSRLSVM